MKPNTRQRDRPVDDEVRDLLAWLETVGTQEVRDGMARYAIPSEGAFGVPVGVLRDRAKRLGKDHELAAGLWATGRYEARLLTCFVDDPAAVTPEQMDAWAAEFADWAICDTACFHLFDKTPHAFAKVGAWAERPEEFVRRAAFALLASLALHAKRASDEPFLRCLPLIETAAADGRNFVKKGVSWALRAYAKRGPEAKAAALDLARRLAASAEPTARWVGKDGLRDLGRPAGKRAAGEEL